MQTAKRLQTLIQDPVIAKFFDEAERALVDAIVNCLPSQADDRLDVAMKLQALRSLRRFLGGEVGRGARAAAKLQTINRDTNNVA